LVGAHSKLTPPLRAMQLVTISKFLASEGNWVNGMGVFVGEVGGIALVEQGGG
jgi:hypothetical protein